MHKRFVVGLLISTIVVAALASVSTYAVGSSSLVISQVQLGTTTSANNEFIELYNNSGDDVEITNWCLYYASASSMSNGSKLGCFDTDSGLIHLNLPTHSYAFAISNQLAATSPILGSDLKFSATLSGTAGHIRLLDEAGTVVDKVGWGATALSSEGLSPALVPPNGKVLQRKSTTNIYQDTNVNSADFELVVPRTSYSYGSVYEVQDLCGNISGIQTTVPADYSVDSAAVCLPPPVDVCTNIDGLQISMPPGYLLDSDGNCQPDVCPNILGLQMGLPDNKEFDPMGNCVDHDMCSNIDAIQAVVPSGYRLDGINCWLDVAHIALNELLPNAAGSDTGNEFIELYNPGSVGVDLSLYRLQVGIDTLKTYSFPAGSSLAANGYVSFSNDDIPFTLVNTSSHVQIVTVDNQSVDSAPTYDQPFDGMSWALIDGVWQYTDQPTPGAQNLASLPSEIVEDSVTGLKPCPDGQYRNPDTNRCRLIVTISSNLAPCKDGQYRSEETNRCRSIASDVASLVPCSEGQERNPLTNRCRTIATTLSAPLSPCKAGEERNPDTNRCRTIVKPVAAGYAVQPVAKSSDNFSGLIALGAVIAAALGYAVWEWRVELTRLFFKLRVLLHLAK